MHNIKNEDTYVDGIYRVTLLVHGCQCASTAILCMYIHNIHQKQLVFKVLFTNCAVCIDTFSEGGYILYVLAISLGIANRKDSCGGSRAQMVMLRTNSIDIHSMN